MQQAAAPEMEQRLENQPCELLYSLCRNSSSYIYLRRRRAAKAASASKLSVAACHGVGRKPEDGWSAPGFASALAGCLLRRGGTPTKHRFIFCDGELPKQPVPASLTSPWSAREQQH